MPAKMLLTKDTKTSVNKLDSKEVVCSSRGTGRMEAVKV